MFSMELTCCCPANPSFLPPYPCAELESVALPPFARLRRAVCAKRRAFINKIKHNMNFMRFAQPCGAHNYPCLNRQEKSVSGVDSLAEFAC
jgi:hypothetical protein